MLPIEIVVQYREDEQKYEGCVSLYQLEIDVEICGGWHSPRTKVFTIVVFQARDNGYSDNFLRQQFSFRV